MQKDNLGICSRCGSDACYEQDLGANYKVYMCYGCGFTTNTLMTEDSEFLEEQLEVLPEIYKDLIYIDDEGIKLDSFYYKSPRKRNDFHKSKSIKDWTWASCPAKELTEEELPKFPEGTTHKMDMKSVKHFNERDFIEAIDYIGLFINPE
jgi:hypothetical protein